MEDHKIFFLSVVAIVAIVGIVGLIVMITGYNLPSETQVGQALLREQAITTTTATQLTETKLLAEVESSMKEIESSMNKISASLDASAQNIKTRADTEKEAALSTEAAELLTAADTFKIAQEEISKVYPSLAKEDFKTSSKHIKNTNKKIQEVNKRLAKTKTKELKEVHPGLINAMENVAKFEKGTIRRTKALSVLKDNLAKWNEELSEEVALTVSAGGTSQPTAPIPVTWLAVECCEYWDYSISGVNFETCALSSVERENLAEHYGIDPNDPALSNYECLSRECSPPSEKCPEKGEADRCVFHARTFEKPCDFEPDNPANKPCYGAGKKTVTCTFTTDGKPKKIVGDCIATPIDFGPRSYHDIGVSSACVETDGTEQCKDGVYTQLTQPVYKATGTDCTIFVSTTIWACNDQHRCVDTGQPKSS